jgi:hypothetical protein
LPLRVGVDVGAVVVEQIGLDVCLTRLVQERKFVGPEVGIVLLGVRVVADVPRARGLERQQVGPERGLVRGAIRPERRPCLPERPEAVVVRDGILNDQRFDALR